LIIGAVDVLEALENWARWCNRVGECYPATPTNWQMIDQMEYKNCHLTTEEKLELLREHQEPDELGALNVERIVQTLDIPKRTAVRIHYVTMPERDRHGFGLTADQWDERRARFATRRARWYFSPLIYRQAVDAAVDAIEAAL